jgi:hypothetical protein
MFDLYLDLCLRTVEYGCLRAWLKFLVKTKLWLPVSAGWSSIDTRGLPSGRDEEQSRTDTSALQEITFRACCFTVQLTANIQRLRLRRDALSSSNSPWPANYQALLATPRILGLSYEPWCRPLSKKVRHKLFCC